MDQNVKLNAVTIVLLAIAKTQINVCLATQALSLIQLLENVSPTWLVTLTAAVQLVQENTLFLKVFVTNVLILMPIVLLALILPKIPVQNVWLVIIWKMENVKHVQTTVLLVWVRKLVSDVLQDISWLKKPVAQLVNANFVMVLVPPVLTILPFVLLAQPITI